MDRRNFLAISALLGGSLSAQVRECLAAVAGPGGRKSERPVLDPPARQRLEALVDRIIPVTDTPGANDAGVPDFIEFMLAEGFAAEGRDRFLAGLAEVERISRADYGASYPALGAERQDAILRRLERESATTHPSGEPLFFQTLKELTVIGYYTSEVGATRELRLDPVPGRFDACVPLEEGDRAFFYSTPLDKLV